MTPRFRATTLDDIDELAVVGGTLRWKPVRRTLGVQAFGINAYVADADQDVVEEHDETGAGSGGHEELYLVLRGHARFAIDGQELDAPAGTVVFLPDPVARRAARAVADGTMVLAIGADPERPYEVSPWEYYFAAEPAMARGDHDAAVATMLEGLPEHEGNPGLHYQLACALALGGRPDEALDHLARAYAAAPEKVREWATGDADLDALREMDGFPIPEAGLMGHVAVTDLAYAHPGGDTLFSEVSFRAGDGAHMGVVGANGVGKTTMFKVIAGLLPADQGDAQAGGGLAYMAQDVGVDDEHATVRELLLSVAPARVAAAGRAMLAAEAELAGGDSEDGGAAAGMRLGEAIADWSELGGYELEGHWDAACRRVVRAGLDEVGPRPTSALSGGERKRLVLELLFASEAQVLLLDEPDNFLDIPAKRWLERLIARSKKTVLLISHDRDLLSAATTSILTLEGHGCWVHGAGYASYPEAREHRQRLLGDRLQQWNDEERRLYQYYRTMKARAAQSDVNAKRADAAETRWKRFVAEGPPPAPVADQQIKVRMRGGDSARKAVTFKELGIEGLVLPFSDEIHLGERVGLVGPNGSGKTHVMRLLAGEPVPHGGSVVIGNRVSPGLFSQLNARADFAGRGVLDIAQERTAAVEPAMRALARYGLQEAARRRYEQLSGGQKARLEILCLELEGHNLLLLDEPTDNLDIDSSIALESALEGFEGTVVAVSHDRAFLRRLDRSLLLDHDRAVHSLPDSETTLAALEDPAGLDGLRLAKRLSVPA